MPHIVPDAAAIWGGMRSGQAAAERNPRPFPGDGRLGHSVAGTQVADGRCEVSPAVGTNACRLWRLIQIHVQVQVGDQVLSFIPTRVHGVLEYVTAGALIARRSSDGNQLG